MFNGKLEGICLCCATGKDLSSNFYHHFGKCIPSPQKHPSDSKLASSPSFPCRVAPWRCGVGRRVGKVPTEGHRVVKVVTCITFANSNLKTSGKKKQSSVVSTSQLFQFCFLLFFGAVQKCQKKTVGSC